MFISKKKLKEMEARLETLEKSFAEVKSPKVLRSLRKQRILAEQNAQAEVKRYYDEVELSDE